MKYLHVPVWVIAVAGLALNTVSCVSTEGRGLPDGYENGGGGADSTALDADLTEQLCGTLETLVLPIFANSCAVSGCHSGTGASMGLDLSSAAGVLAAVGTPSAMAQEFSLVSAGAPESSFLALKLHPSPPAGTRMPLGLPPLGAAQIAVIEAWIAGGAGQEEFCTEATEPTPDGDTSGPDGADSQDSELGQDSSPNDVGSEELCRDFATHVQPILTARCAFSGCHGGASPSMGLSLEAGQSLQSLQATPSLGPGPFVAPGDLAASWLWVKVNPNPPGGQRMPIGGALTPLELDVLGDWILAGGGPEPFCVEGEPEPTVASVQIVGESGALKVGDLRSLGAVALDSQGNEVQAPVIWKSNDESLLYVDSVGTVLAVAPGSAGVVAEVAGVQSTAFNLTVESGAPAPASFAGEVMPFFKTSCAISGCHVDDAEAGDLRLDRPTDKMYEKLVGEEAEQSSLDLVSAGAPNQSYLWLKMGRSTPPAGAMMPIGAAPLNAGALQALLKWIAGGAPYN